MGLRYFWDLLTQRERVDAFREAITAVVRPGDVVLELGTGLGTFALFAARAGGRVWAVDADPVVHVARALALENGLADRVTFVRGRFPDIELPEPADVVIFEDFPPRVVDARVVAYYAALHARFAKPGARWIPRAVRRVVAPAGGEGLARALQPLGPDDAAYGLTWRAARSWLEQEPQQPPDGTLLLGAPQPLDVVPCASAPGTWALGGAVALRTTRAGSLAGLMVWGNLELADGITLSNAPDAGSASWGRVLLPVAPAVPVTPATALTARVGHDGEGSWLSWEVQGAGAGYRGHELAGRPADRRDLLAGSPDAVPALSTRGQAARDLLGAIDGTRDLETVAGVLGRTYPWMARRDAVRLAAALLEGLVQWHPPEGHHERDA